MLNVWANGNPSGRLNKINGNTYSFTYLPDKPYRAAVSLTMPVRPESWLWRFGLHPIFDMNLPEGALRRWLEGMFSKTVPDFDDLEEPTFQKVAQNMLKAWEEGVRGLEY
jgi:serine/threonine-protein kinase HipA